MATGTRPADRSVRTFCSRPHGIKTIAGQSRTKLRGLARVRWSLTLAAAAYSSLRLPRKLAGSAG